MTREVERFQFNFGPISRTLGEGGDYLGFASLPVHEAVTALLGARNRDEFIAWLWHDTFKALFEWELTHGGKPSWRHLPQSEIERLAGLIGSDPQRILRHHVRPRDRKPDDLLSESGIVTNEFTATYLGSQAHFVQLSFACQPTAHTMPIRQCITEAFLRAVSQVVSRSIEEFNLPFKRVLYKFQPAPRERSATKIKARYQLQVIDEALEVVHWIPSEKFKTTQLSLDLVDAPPHLEMSDALALIELLTVYRDELTTVAAVPLFLDDLDAVVEEIRTAMSTLLPDIFEQVGIQLTHKRAAITGLLDVVLEQMVEVRPIAENCNKEYEAMWKGKPQKRLGKPVHELIQRPYQLMADSSRVHVCIVCGTPIGQEAADCYRGSPRLRTIFSGNFTDFEHVGFEGIVCPLCLIYANSKNKKLLRGTQAFLAPSTALSAPVGSQLVEKPRFDSANRFDPKRSLPKTAVTLQEMVLLTAISRRIVDALINLAFKVRSNGGIVGEIIGQTGKEETPVGVYLPYAGVYLIYHPTAVRTLYRDTLVGSDLAGPNLWQTVGLRAYPFQLELSPAFTLLISLQVRASKFRGRHTLLKSHPTQVFLSPTASFNVLVDDAFQETVDSGLAEAIRLLRQLADMHGLKQREFINALLTGHDPVEAAYLAAKRPSRPKGEAFRLNQAERFWNRKEVAAGKNAVEQWSKFTQLAEQVRELAQAHPTLLNLL